MNASSIYAAIEATEATELVTNIQSVIDSMTTDYRDDIDVTSLSFWLNISIPEISIEFANLSSRHLV